MAKEKPEVVDQTASEPTPQPQTPPKQETVYTAAEFAQHPELFGRGPDIIVAALDHAKVESCTIARAKELVKDFSERKVN